MIRAWVGAVVVFISTVVVSKAGREVTSSSVDAACVAMSVPPVVPRDSPVEYSSISVVSSVLLEGSKLVPSASVVRVMVEWVVNKAVVAEVESVVKDEVGDSGKYKWNKVLIWIFTH